MDVIDIEEEIKTFKFITEFWQYYGHDSLNLLSR